jgi:uncharacterized protein YggU (UPF0235/DUF167 family)
MNAIRTIQKSTSSLKRSYLQIRTRVKPGASKLREGNISANDDAVEICVSEQAKDGRANQAVVRLLSDILHVPKSAIQISHGNT